MTASCGGVTDASTASMMPWRITTVPVSMVPLETVTIRAPRIAYTPGASADVAAANATAAPAAASTTRRTLRPPRVALVQRELLVVEAHVASIDDDVRDRGTHLERVAPADDEIGDLARFDAADLVRHAEDLGGVDGQRAQRLRARQPPRHGAGGVIRQLPNVL